MFYAVDIDTLMYQSIICSSFFISFLFAHRYQDLKEKNATLNVCHKDGQFTKIVPWLTIGVCCLQIFKEFCQALHFRWKYLKDPVNWFEFTLYMSSLLFMLPFILCQVGGDVDEVMLYNLKWQAGAVSILFAWFNLLLYLKRFPFFGLYVLMFTEVLSTLLNVLCVFSILVVGFALSFYSLFKIPEQTFDDLAKNNVTAEPGSFRMVGTSLVRIMVMMIGELDYRAMFTENFPDERKPLLPHKVMSYTVFILFVIIMTIIVMNLLVSRVFAFLFVYCSHLFLEFQFRGNNHYIKEDKFLIQITMQFPNS